MSSPPQRPSVTAEQPIGGDRELVLQHLPERQRPAFAALFVLDAAMGDVVARARDPALGRIKLAWWREQLEQLEPHSPPREPRLRAVAEHLLGRGMDGAELGGLEPGWATLLDERIDPALVAERGVRLFRIGGRLLGHEDDRLADAGALHALVSVARRGVPELFDHAAEPAARLAGHRFPRPLRSLTGLARLAVRDLERSAEPELEGSAVRAAAMLRHRWSGVVVGRRG